MLTDLKSEDASQSIRAMSLENLLFAYAVGDQRLCFSLSLYPKF